MSPMGVAWLNFRFGVGLLLPQPPQPPHPQGAADVATAGAVRWIARTKACVVLTRDVEWCFGNLPVAIGSLLSFRPGS